MSTKLDILAFGAHPDDVELSAAGTLALHHSMGYSFGLVDLTEGEMGTRGTVETRYAEAAEAAKILGCSVRVNLQMKDGWFEQSEENLLKVVTQIRRFQPEIVLANAIEDRHPDHGRGAALVARACFLAGLRKVETSWEGEPQAAWRPKSVYHYIQDRYLQPDFVVDITPFIDLKIAAILAYKTQFWDPNSMEPATPISGKDFMDFIQSRMREMGRPIQAEFAEGFTVDRTFGVKNLFDLK